MRCRSSRGHVMTTSKVAFIKKVFFFLLSLVNVVLTSEIQYEPALFVAYMYFSC